jgi:mRNA-degrading endonuclease RelE of RelBE toxin-antitoxin system
MNYNIFYTDSFEKEIKKLSKKYPSLKQDFENLKTSLEENPIQGQSLGKDCYKIRMAITSKGKGKSGGGRVITCVKVVASSVFLIAIYDKSETESIDDSKLDSLLKKAGL